jgi:hypothetical protein
MEVSEIWSYQGGKLQESQEVSTVGFSSSKRIPGQCLETRLHCLEQIIPFVNKSKPTLRPAQAPIHKVPGFLLRAQTADTHFQLVRNLEPTSNLYTSRSSWQRAN